MGRTVQTITKKKVDIVDLIIQKFNKFTNPIPIYSLLAMN